MDIGTDTPKSSTNIFHTLSKDFGFVVPNYLVAMLKVSGFDNLDSLINFEKNDIDDVEIFVTNRINTFGTIDKREILSFFSSNMNEDQVSQQQNKRLVIPPGHRKLCIRLQDICKSNEDKLRSLMKPKASPKAKIAKTCNCPCTCQTKIANQRNNQKENASKEIMTKTDNEAVIDHIKTLIKTYVKKSLNIKEDDERSNNIDLENIEVTYETDNLAKVKCIFKDCARTCNITSKTLKGGAVKWTLSNIYKHMSTVHLGNKRSLKKKIDSLIDSSEEPAPKQRTIASYFEKASNKTTSLSSTDKYIIDENSVAGPTEIVYTVNSMIDPSKDTQLRAQLYLEPLCSSSTESSTEQESLPQPISAESTTRSTINILSDITLLDQNFLVKTGVTKETGNPEKSEQSPSEAKWRNFNYSRHQRHLRNLESFDPKQLKITDFFNKVIEGIETVISGIEQNDKISETTSERTDKEKLEMKHELDGLLKIFIETKNANFGKNKSKQNYDEEMKRISLFIFMLSGRYLYEILHANMRGVLPSLSTLYRCLDKNNKMEEGATNFENLKTFLEKRNLPLKIFISEDQTAIVKKVSYDPATNTMVGFVSPLEKSGFPVKRKYKLDSVKDVEVAFERENLAVNALVIMAQPLCDVAPAFCLALFGSDNKFNTDDVLSRWEFLQDEATKFGISIEGFASDGDTRCLKAMKIKAGIPKITENIYKPYFQMDFNTEVPICMQDTIHICTKLKTRLTKPGAEIILGKFKVSPAHIEKLIELHPKDQHMLSLSCLDNTDKMNFKSIDKLCSKNVIKMLKLIPDSDGTVQYLRICRFIIESMLDKSFDVKSRVYKLWYCIFCLRLWRKWLLNNGHSLQKNFITLNAYTCLEINGHSLLLMIEKCREAKTLFLPWLYSSQPCEEIFRKVRSMTTTYSTIVNFSLLELIRRLNRVQALNNFNTDFRDKIHFPREEGRLGKSKLNLQDQELPDTDAVFSVLEKARVDAVIQMNELGLQCETDDWISVNITSAFSLTQKEEEPEEPYNMPPIEVYLSEDDKSEVNMDLNKLRRYNILTVKDYKYEKSKTVGSSFLKVDVNGKEMIIRKSTLCWLFSEENGRLSTDRLNRVRGMREYKKSKKKEPQLETKAEDSGTESETEEVNMVLENDDDPCTETSKSESKSENEEIIESTEESTSQPKLQLKNKQSREQFYAIFEKYNWRIAQLDEQYDNNSRVKFLKKQLEGFCWPDEEEIQTIKNSSIFYGPIQLEHQKEGHYLLKRTEALQLNRKYKELKCKTI